MVRAGSDPRVLDCYSQLIPWTQGAHRLVQGPGKVAGVSVGERSWKKALWTHSLPG